MVLEGGRLSVIAAICGPEYELDVPAFPGGLLCLLGGLEINLKDPDLLAADSRRVHHLHNVVTGAVAASRRVGHRNGDRRPDFNWSCGF